MMGPHLRKPWTADEQLIVSGIRRGLSYAEIGVELAAKTGRAKPLAANTIRHYTAHLVSKIEWGEAPEGLVELAPRIAVCTYEGIRETVATMRERFYKTA
jgi:hypothetical protein